MEDLNLHFTGDLHAIGAANNLLAAILESHLLHGNALGIDPLSISWRRCVDMNDRALRQIAVGLGGRANGYVRETGFDITAASEVMAIVAVARDLFDLRRRLGAITVGHSFAGEPITAEALNAAGAMTVLLKDALKPNLVQTLEGQPALVHCGPFANIAHGNNSLVADLVALKLGDYVVTESGFGSDMGMEKFLNIVCRAGGLSPSAVVLVATVRALEHHGGEPDGGPAAIERGAANLRRHLEIVHSFGLKAVVAVNRFPGDTDEEVELVRRLALDYGAHAAELNEGFERGGPGAAALAEAVVDATRDAPAFDHTYPIDGADRGEDPSDRDQGLRRRRHLRPEDGAGQDRRVHRGGPRPAADLHGEDAPLALARRGPRERTRGLHRHSPGHPRLHRRGLARRPLRRHADDARARRAARRVHRRHRRGRQDSRLVLSTIPAMRIAACLVALLALTAAVSASARTDANGIPAYVDGYAKWPKLNAKPILGGSSAHQGTKNVYASKRKTGVNYPVGAIVVKTARPPGKQWLSLVATMRKIRGTRTAAGAGRSSRAPRRRRASRRSRSRSRAAPPATCRRRRTTTCSRAASFDEPEHPDDRGDDEIRRVPHHVVRASGREDRLSSAALGHERRMRLAHRRRARRRRRPGMLGDDVDDRKTRGNRDRSEPRGGGRIGLHDRDQRRRELRRLLPQLLVLRPVLGEDRARPRPR